MNMRPTCKPWLPAVDLSLMSTPKLVEDFYERIWNEGIWMPQQSCSHRNSRSVAHSGTKCEIGKHARITFVLFARLLPIISAKFFPALRGKPGFCQDSFYRPRGGISRLQTDGETRPMAGSSVVQVRGFDDRRVVGLRRPRGA